MRRTTRMYPLLAATAVSALLALSGCGASDDVAKTGTGDSSGVRLSHVDGTLTLDGETLTVAPANGDDELELTLGPVVDRGPTSALAAAGTRARVFYNSDGVAASVEPAPSATQDLPTYTGEVTDVSDTSISIDGPDGKRAFTIRPQDATAFDTEHLTEHKQLAAPVLVYYRSEHGTDFAVAYEDA